MGNDDEATPASGMAAAKALLAFVPPATLITGLLFYFGWARTYAQASALGADASLFGYSTRDYMLRSVDSLFFPMMAFIAVGLLVMLGHAWIRARLASRPAGARDPLLVRCGTVLMVVGFAIVLFGGLYAAGRLGRGRLRDLLGPLALGAGVLISAYGGWLRSHAREATRPGSPGPAWTGPVAAGLLLSIAALSMFWAVGNYATWRGQDLAITIAETYRTRPMVVIYSAQSLALEGVQQAALSEPDAAYKWRYSGLRLLDRVGTTYFLMPEDWASHPRLILLTETAGMRFEFTAG